MKPSSDRNVNPNNDIGILCQPLEFLNIDIINNLRNLIMRICIPFSAILSLYLLIGYQTINRSVKPQTPETTLIEIDAIQAGIPVLGNYQMNVEVAHWRSIIPPTRRS